MGWQIVTAIAAFLFTGRAVLFVLGVIIGGMLTASSPAVLEMMTTLVQWWSFVTTAIFGS